MTVHKKIVRVSYVVTEMKQSYYKWMQLTGKKKKRTQELIWLGSKGSPLGIVQAIKVLPYNQMVYAQIRLRPGEWDA